MTSITSIINNGDGTYDIHFDAAAAVTIPGNGDPQILMYSPGFDSWQSIQNMVQVNPTTIEVTDGANATDNSLLAILNNPENLTALQPFQLVTPLIPIP